MNAKVRVFGGKTDHTHTPDGSEPVDDRPRSVYELMTRRMLEEMREDVNDIKGRVNTLLWMVAGAALLELVMRLVK
jgi:hypothetical protein